MLGYYEGSLSKALIHLFPNIGLEDQKFNHSNPPPPPPPFPLPSSLISSLPNSIPTKDIVRVSNSHIIFKLSLTKQRISHFQFTFFLFIYFLIGSKWANQESRTSFFADLARTKGFDPLNPANWYTYAPLMYRVCLLLLFSGDHYILSFSFFH